MTSSPMFQLTGLAKPVAGLAVEYHPEDSNALFALAPVQDRAGRPSDRHPAGTSGSPAG